MMKSSEDFLDALEKDTGKKIPQKQKDVIRQRLGVIFNYEPTVGVFGKTGTGKSSLCNALFGADICPISAIESCTREYKEILLQAGGRGIKLLDVPGVGESQERNIEYRSLYNDLLPKLDVVLWLLKGDERAFAEDEEFYKNVVKPHVEKQLPIFFVINQADKIEPFREWDEAAHEPSPIQFQNIHRKAEVVARTFQIPQTSVISISANEKWHLVELVDSIVNALPRDKRIGFFKAVNDENRSEDSVMVVRKAWADATEDIVYDVTGNKTLAKGAAFAAGLVEDAVDWFKGKLSSLWPW